MGDPKKHRKKYSTPNHPWQKLRIDDERQLTQEYGFKNKTEIWKMNSFLRKATAQAKKLVTLSGPQADKERELLLQRLKRYNLLPPEAGLDAILSISLRDLLERRLQTIVYKKQLANSMKQARQFITHQHITINGTTVTSPSYLVPVSEEGMIAFKPTSTLADEEHPERVAAKKVKERAPKAAVEGGAEERPRRDRPKAREPRKDFKKAPAREKKGKE
ncbi:30S ribosomal protein S4 [Candidatus Woesearchaeota archaeon]|nr:30S ribosomal protein S4 [Candidatus Woesearchaeota archaeon]